MIRVPIFRRCRLLLAVAMATILAGCSFGGEKTVTLYSPQLHLETKAEWPAAAWSLVVAKPTASEALDSARIAVRPQPSTLQVYQGAVWSDPAPELLQNALVRAFEDSGKLVAVGRQSSGLHGDVALLLDMRRFEAAYDQPGQAPHVVIELQAKLLANSGSKVLATRTFRTEVAASSGKIPAVIAAFETALSQSLGDIVGWTLASGQANSDTRAPSH